MKQLPSPYLAGGLSLLMVLAVIWPVQQNWAEKSTDSFPLSHYPMFSQARHGKARMTYLLGVNADGKRQYLPYQLAGTGGANQVRKVIAKRAKKDPARLCQSVADAISRGRESVGNVRTVKIMTGEFGFDRFFAGDQTPTKSTVLCSCEVKRDQVAIRKNQ